MHIDQIVRAARDAVTVQRIFGEPYERDGLTLIPAAAVTGGYGGGAGRGEQGQDGEGGGFGMSGRPVGAFVVRGDDVVWKPVVDPARILAVAGTVAVVYLLTRRPRPRPRASRLSPRFRAPSP
jgi:uncharacterized spore protein YtfJ